MTRDVVVGVDGSGTSLAAARWAAAEAAGRGLRLRMVSAVGKRGTGRSAPVARLVGSASAALARTHPGLDITAHERPGRAADVLTEAAGDAGLLVLSTRGLGGFAGLRLGSVALETAGRAPCAVVLVPAAGVAEARVPEIVLGIDARRPDDAALDAAFDTARRRRARLRAVHAWRLPPPHDTAPVAALEGERGAWEDEEVHLLHAALRPWRDTYPSVGVLPDVRLFGSADALVRASASADLLVVGRGTGGVPALGGVPHAVAHHARCPVLLGARESDTGSAGTEVRAGASG